MTAREKRSLWIYLLTIHIAIGVVVAALTPLFVLWLPLDVLLFGLQAADLHRS